MTYQTLYHKWHLPSDGEQVPADGLNQPLDNIDSENNWGDLLQTVLHEVDLRSIMWGPKADRPGSPPIPTSEYCWYMATDEVPMGIYVFSQSTGWQTVWDGDADTVGGFAASDFVHADGSVAFTGTQTFTQFIENDAPGIPASAGVLASTATHDTAMALQVGDDTVPAGTAGYAAGLRYYTSSGEQLASLSADTAHNHWGVYTKADAVGSGDTQNNKRLSVNGGSEAVDVDWQKVIEHRVDTMGVSGSEARSVLNATDGQTAYVRFIIGSSSTHSLVADTDEFYLYNYQAGQSPVAWPATGGTAFDESVFVPAETTVHFGGEATQPTGGTTNTQPSGSVNVVNYGADSSGGTDSTTAINDAITAAGAGGTVWFPQGTYLTSGGHTLNGTRLLGEGRDITTLQATASGAFIDTSAAGWSIESLRVDVTNGTGNVNDMANNQHIRHRLAHAGEVIDYWIYGVQGRVVATGGDPGPEVFAVRDTSGTVRLQEVYMPHGTGVPGEQNSVKTLGSFSNWGFTGTLEIINCDLRRAANNFIYMGSPEAGPHPDCLIDGCHFQNNNVGMRPPAGGSFTFQNSVYDNTGTLPQQDHSDDQYDGDTSGRMLFMPSYINSTCTMTVDNCEIHTDEYYITYVTSGTLNMSNSTAEGTNGIYAADGLVSDSCVEGPINGGISQSNVTSPCDPDLSSPIDLTSSGGTTGSGSEFQVRYDIGRDTLTIGSRENGPVFELDSAGNLTIEGTVTTNTAVNQ